MAETVDITPASPPHAVEDPSKEVRIGLVLYGGVSLAIYIYGVVYEVWRLVRASRGVAQNAYTALLRTADAWATVDIASGASAGGINGVLLAKALATGADLGAVRTLWVDGADLDKLLRSTSEKDPPSLLSSDVFEKLVADGLAALDRSVGTQRPLVDVLDLFAPGTRLRPYKRVAVDDLGQQVEMREYRKIFHLKFRKRGYNAADPSLGYDQNDFRPEMNTALAGVIRATSAFPAAFEPRRVTNTADTERLFAEGEPGDAWFSDGGILHNRPFTETLATIFTRAAERPVSRWLLSVEPDPEHFKVPPGPDIYPEVPEVVGKALMGIPRYQSIAGDLAEFAAHGDRVNRAQSFLRGVDEVVGSVDGRVFDDDETFAGLLGSQLLHKAYRPLRAQALARALQDELVAAVPFTLPRQPDSAALGVTRFVEGLAGEADEIDAAYELRRVYYLLERVRAVRGNLDPDALRRLAPLQRSLWAEFDRVQQLLWTEFHDPNNRRAAALRALATHVDEDLAASVAEALETARTPVKTGLDAVREKAASICDDLDRELGSAAEPRFSRVFRRYELWDMFVLPIDQLADAGERDHVRFIRISPEAATYIRKPPKDKLAGDTLRHFGAFAWRDWRQNDILWGRLDAAEILTRVVLADQSPSQAELDEAIRTVQGEIVAEELPDLEGDYRTHLENEYAVGSQGLDVIPANDRVTFVMRASTVSRNLMRRLADRTTTAGLPAVFRWSGRGLGMTITVFRWPVLAVWGKDNLVSRAATLVVVFLAGWAVLSAVLVVLFDVADVGKRFWVLVGLSIAIFVVWIVLRTWLAHKLDRKRVAP
jgi:hypothetical protein